MNHDTDRIGVGPMLLAILAMGLCCGGPLLIVAGGAIVAAIGWTVLGVGAGVALIVVAAAAVAYRYRRAAACQCAVEPREPRGIQRGN
jgi:hypothetical protein